MSTGRPRLRVLLIDDDPDVLSFMESALRDRGYEPTTARSSSEGLRLARADPPDLICLDISMPPPTGVEVYRQLRSDSRLSRLPVVMVTGVDRRFERFISSRRHLPPPDAYLAKPFQPEALFEIIDRLLGRDPMVH